MTGSILSDEGLLHGQGARAHARSGSKDVRYFD
jgi:hypothetical protein